MKRNWLRVAQVLKKIEDDCFPCEIHIIESPIETLGLESRFMSDEVEVEIDCQTDEDTLLISNLLDAELIKIFDNQLQMTWAGFDLLDSLRSILKSPTEYNKFINEM